MRFPSVQLFVDRAQLARPDFHVARANARAIAELCDRLEGIPLAIELAAAQASVMSPAQMLGHLARRFDFLVSRHRDTAVRHRTLRAAIDWSFHLLTPALQGFFARLSVFRGGWTLEAAEAICADFGFGTPEPNKMNRIDGMGRLGRAHPIYPAHPVTVSESQVGNQGVLPALAELRAHSLIVLEEREPEMRFRMLETLREYAVGQLRGDEGPALQRRHARYYLTLAEQAQPEFWRALEADWLDRLETEHDNLLAALEWDETAADGGETGLRLAAALAHFWAVRGYVREGRERLARALTRAEASGATTARAYALHGAGILAYHEADYTPARALHEEGLAVSRELGDRELIALSLNRLGLVAYHQRDLVSAKALYEESLAIRREIGDRQGVAASLSNLGYLAVYQGDDVLARTCFEESLAVFRETGHDEGIASSLRALASVARTRGDYTTARSLYQQSLATYRQLGYQRGIASQLQCLAAVAAGQGEPERAARLYGAAAALWEAMRTPLLAEDRDHEVRVASLRGALGEAAFHAAWEAGRALPWEQAVDEALQE